MRRRLGAVAASAFAVAALPLVSAPAGAASDAGVRTGEFLTPFREDGAHGTGGPGEPGRFGGPNGDTGCDARTDDPTDPPTLGPRATKCLPAGATEVVLANSRILYWNALEGSETFGGGTVPEGGAGFQNDPSRVMSMDYRHGAGASWLAARTGYFPGTPGQGTPLPRKA